ncbi:nuclear transport factor 2 family protein [Actinoplanes sp. M2I2]|uniref:nuclear transport factor 2 family protein n=1 Tax=Actinoplanes sp. M2I2 TaxID=1734444 RepID=UPI0020224C4B|nr:nuclear transport factor 2 family protein [Actinoplanes sp. M2I2]
MDHNVALAHKNLLGVFGERDRDVRAAAIREVYAEDVTFADPEEVTVGRDDLDRKVQRLLDEAPGFVFTPVGEVRSVQNLTLLSWQLGPAGEPPVVSGTDIAIVEDGRIKHLYTMLDAPSAPATA